MVRAKQRICCWVAVVGSLAVGGLMHLACGSEFGTGTKPTTTAAGGTGGGAGAVSSGGSGVGGQGAAPGGRGPGGQGPGGQGPGGQGQGAQGNGGEGGGGNCLTCAQWLEKCTGGECGSTELICEGDPRKNFNSLLACVCPYCDNECLELCGAIYDDLIGCGACVSLVAELHCKTEKGLCLTH
jgi:hypothetical protein